MENKRKFFHKLRRVFTMMKPEELREHLKGITVISITPFKENGDFDAKGYEKKFKIFA